MSFDKIDKNLSRKIYFLPMLCFIAIFLVSIASAGTTAEPTVTKTASPTDINIAGSGVAPEETTVAITVTGAGSTTTSATPMDVVFAIDSSGSMGPIGVNNDPSNLRLSAAKSFIDKMDSSRDTSGVVSWDDHIDLSVSLTNDFTFLKSQIDKIDSEGGTDLNVGLAKAIDILNTDTRTGDSAKVIIFLTDGIGSYSSSTAQAAAQKGYKIYTIGLGNYLDPAPLQDMATITGGKYYSSPDAENLQAIFNDIFVQVTTSTIPYNVEVIETTQSYIVDESSFNIAPDSVVTDGSGITTITWENIGMGDGSPDLKDNEQVVLSFNAKSTRAGVDLGVDALGTAKVNYKDSQGNDAGSVDIPQAYINVNAPPAANAGADLSANEGDSVTFSGSFEDPNDSGAHTFEWDFGDRNTASNTASGTLTPSHIYADNGVYTVTLKVTDEHGLIGTDTLTVTVKNVDPVVGEINTPVNPIKLGTPVTVDSTFTDVGVLDTHTAVCDWEDDTSPETVSVTENNGAGTVTGTHTYTTPGIYTVRLTVTDKDGGSGSSVSLQYIVIYNPEGGFVTGGGWINSPEGAYAKDPSLAGTANFGFVSKYQKGATVPTGVTEFNFKVADLNFHSDSFDWLVVAGTRAQYKGTGTINGEGQYGFMLTAIDGQVTGGDGTDKFRIKIWDKASGDQTVYDNMMGKGDTEDITTIIQKGSITIHNAK